jgi:hypothetical protein
MSCSKAIARDAADSYGITRAVVIAQRGEKRRQGEAL